MGEADARIWGYSELCIERKRNEAAVDPLESTNAWTPLMVAALKSTNSPRHVSVILTLLKAGADFEVTDARGNTVLHILASLGQTELIKQLLELIPSVDILGPGFGYLTPLHYAAEAGHAETVGFLLQQGADPRGLDATGWTPLHWACRRGSKRVIDHLLRWGGSLGGSDFRSLSPLDVASLFGHAALTKLLEAQVPEPRGVTLTVTAEGSLEKGACDENQKDAGSNGDSLEVIVKLQEQVTVLPFHPPEPRSRLPDKDAWTVTRWVLAFLIRCFSVCDYASRISFAALATATAVTVQGVGPYLLAATVLAYASAVLPSIGLGICCSGHFKSAWFWASWKAAAALHLFAGSADDTKRRVLHGRWGPYKQLSTVGAFCRVCRVVTSSDRNTAVRLLAAGCLLPVAALACFLWVCFQVVVVIFSASLAVLALWVCVSLLLLALKFPLVSRCKLLHLLDLLTRGSAVQLCLTSPGAEESCSAANSVPRRSPCHATNQKTDRVGLACQLGGQQSGTHPYAWSCDSAHALGTMCESASQCQSTTPGRVEQSSGRGRFASVQAEAATFEVTRDSSPGEDDHAAKKATPHQSASYTKATLCGTVALELHPCTAFRGSMHVYHQHLVAWRVRRCLSSRWGRHVPGGGGGASPSQQSSEVECGRRPPTSEVEFSATQRGWRFHGSSAGLFADSDRWSPATDATSPPPVMCEEAKKKYWSSGLEAGSIVNLQTTSKLAERHTSSDGSAVDFADCGLLSFAYSKSSRAGERVVRAAQGACNTANLAADVSRIHDSLSVSSVILPSLLAEASPSRWLRDRIAQQRASTPCPPASPSFRTQETRKSRPGIPAVPRRSEEGGNCCSNAKGRTPCSQFGNSGTQPGWLDVKLLFAASAKQPAASTLNTELSACQADSAPKQRSGIHVLRRRRHKPSAAELDDAEYEKLVLRREQLIFQWFERLVAFRYFEIKRTREVVTQQRALSFEHVTDQFHKVPVDPGSSCPTRAPSVEQGKEDIKWSSLNTLFPQESSAVGVDELGGILAVPTPVDGEVLSCMPTEDLFSLPEKKMTPRFWTLQSGRRPQLKHATSASCRIFSDEAELTGSSKSPEECVATEETSTRGASAFEMPASPLLHFRFNDMVEMPYLRETFFNFWCREFEKLLVYQDQFFESNPFWICNVLEEDGFSAYSEEDKLVSPRLTGESSAQREPNSTQRSLDCSNTEGVQWLVSQRSRESRDLSGKQSELEERLRCNACNGSNEGREGICVCKDVIGPPMTYAVAVNLGKLEQSKRPTLLRGRAVALKRQEDDEVAAVQAPLSRHCSSLSQAASSSSDTLEATGTAHDSQGSCKHLQNRFLPVVDICRFMFALVLTLDLLLGLLPLLGALLLVYFLPAKEMHSTVGASVLEASQTPSNCFDSALSPIFFPGGYLVSPSSLTASVAFCALHSAAFWSIILALLASLFSAALLVCQASSLFFPVQAELRAKTNVTAGCGLAV
ncbi:hypothetical protein Efla_003742 [Eimeria flavescens]